MVDKKKREVDGCQYLMYNLKPCCRFLHDKKYCIFHSRDIKGKKAGFNKLFWEEFKKQKKEKKEYNFEGFIFPNSISFRISASDIPGPCMRLSFSILCEYVWDWMSNSGELAKIRYNSSPFCSRTLPKMKNVAGILFLWWSSARTGAAFTHKSVLSKS